MQFKKVEKYIKDLLLNNLPKYLTYHGIVHTEKVLEASIVLAENENITNKSELILLKTAALFHDCGFIKTYNGHEDEGCKIAIRVLPDFGYSSDDIHTICNMIMATKLPQSPKNLLEEILCDADLYYLGSDSFESVTNKLLKEWIAIKKVHDENEFNLIQVGFLEAHHFWTKSAKKLRDKKKADHLKKLKIKLHQEL